MGYIKNICYAIPGLAAGGTGGWMLAGALNTNIDFLFNASEKVQYAVQGGMGLGLGVFAGVCSYYFLDMAVEGIKEGWRKRVKIRAHEKALEKIIVEEKAKERKGPFSKR